MQVRRWQHEATQEERAISHSKITSLCQFVVGTCHSPDHFARWCTATTLPQLHPCATVMCVDHLWTSNAWGSMPPEHRIPPLLHVVRLAAIEVRQRHLPASEMSLRVVKIGMRWRRRDHVYPPCFPQVLLNQLYTTMLTCNMCGLYSDHEAFLMGHDTHHCKDGSRRVQCRTCRNWMDYHGALVCKTRHRGCSIMEQHLPPAPSLAMEEYDPSAVHRVS